VPIKLIVIPESSNTSALGCEAEAHLDLARFVWAIDRVWVGVGNTAYKVEQHLGIGFA